jgi:HrpA-like RNA helicase
VGGSQIRFDSTRSKHTKVVFMTEGILLRRLTADPTLAEFDVVILDEVKRLMFYGTPDESRF